MAHVTYKAAGVDLDRYDAIVGTIKRVLSRASESSGGGLFAGIIDVGEKRDQIIVASADGVGTKVKVAGEYGRYGGLGRDIVAHCVNDILCVGARPIGFLDYVAFDRLDPAVLKQLLSGIAGECRRCGVQLIGGETAEMPGVYRTGQCDLAGFMIGLASRSTLLDGSKVRKGDLIVGLPSNGLHTNGYSLARKVLLEKRRMDLKRPPKGWREPLGTALLRPHTNYFHAVYPSVEKRLVSGIAHITGGGIAGNLERILPRRLGAVLRKRLWKVPRIFDLIAACGPVSEDEMFRVFNMGLGMVLVVPAQDLPRVLRQAAGSRIVGEIVVGRVPGAGRVIIT